MDGAAETTRWAGDVMSASPAAGKESFTLTENETSSQDENNGGWFGSYDSTSGTAPGVENLIFVILWLICSVTIVGNVLVIAAFARDRQLPLKPANLFILNLSVSDLLIGLVSVSFYTVWKHTEIWVVGEVVCKLWNIIDYTASTQAGVAIVLISFDRLMLVSKGLKYQKYITLRLTRSLIIASWLFSFGLNSIPILCSDAVFGPWVDYGQDCDFAILYIFAYRITNTIFSFVIPFICLSTFNIIVYNNIRARSRGFHRGRSSGLNGGAPARNHTRGSTEYRKHRKAAITLALIVGVFLICWLPWYVSKTIEVIALDLTFNSAVTDAFIYLLWANSAINPFLYAVTHPRIRAGLIACIMCCVPKTCKPVRTRGGSRSHSGDQTQRQEMNRTRTATGVTKCCNEGCNNQGSSV